MPYGMNGNPYPQSPTNNLWFGNNYASGYSQASRSMNNPMNPNMQQPMQQMSGMQGIPQQNSLPQTMNNIIQVMGPESAVNYAIGPNSHIMMADTNRPVVYDKKSDDSGYSETRAYQLIEIPLFPDQNNNQTQESTQQINTDDFVTKSELEEFKKTIEDLVMNNG